MLPGHPRCVCVCTAIGAQLLQGPLVSPSGVSSSLRQPRTRVFLFATANVCRCCCCCCCCCHCWCRVYVRCAAAEKRWTLFSSCWYLWQELRFFGIPPAVRYLAHLVWRGVMTRLYEAHKLLVLTREWWGVWRGARGMAGLGGVRGGWWEQCRTCAGAQLKWQQPGWPAESLPATPLPAAAVPGSHVPSGPACLPFYLSFLPACPICPPCLALPLCLPCPACCVPTEAKVDAGLASRATSGGVTGFSRAMALRRLHWKNSLLGELLYLVNVSKVRRRGGVDWGGEALGVESGRVGLFVYMCALRMAAAVWHCRQAQPFVRCHLCQAGVSFGVGVH
jgi:hypothetical protein